MRLFTALQLNFVRVNFDRVNAEEKFTAEPELEDTELVVNDIIQHAGSYAIENT